MTTRPGVSAPTPRRLRHLGSRVVVFSGLTLVALLTDSTRAQQEPPRFTSSVEVTSIDVTVVDDRSRPIAGLQPGDFTVRVDDAPRRVVTTEWVSMAAAAGVIAPEPPPEGYSTNETGSGGRLVVIVIDQPNIGFGGMASIQPAVEAFIDRLQPSDRIAAVGIGPGTGSTPFTADRELVKRAIGRMAGQKTLLIDDRYNISLTEALDVVDPGRSYAGTLPRIVDRECDGLMGVQLQSCANVVRNVAASFAMQVLADGRQTVAALKTLLTGLRTVDAPKTLILVSEGFLMGEELSALSDVGSLAAEARTSIYALKLEQSADASHVLAPTTARIDDRLVTAQGLEVLAMKSRGSLFDVTVSAHAALDRIESEISGYYLLGIESEPSDKDGRSHVIDVRVGRSGAMVRSRRDLTPVAAAPRSPRQAAMDALASPLAASALPLRVATFSLQGPEASRVQLLIHADVGSGYSSTRAASLAYVITDANNRIVDSQTATARLSPVMNGVPSPLQYSGGASLPPGEYKLKLAVAEGERVGSVEHSFRANLVSAGSFNLSELIVGGPAQSRPPLRPTVGHTVSFGLLHAYVEAYGDGAGGLRVKYEVAPGPDAPPVLEADAVGQTAGNERAIFTHMLMVRQLPPGTYTLRALVSPASRPQGDSTVPPTAAPIKVMTRTFEVARPAVLMASAEGAGSAVATSEVFLPVPDELFARLFRPEEASEPATLEVFRKRLASTAMASFDKGVELLAAGDYLGAESSFKAAIDVEANSTAPLTYLAATFAASGHDLEAASAWQTALIQGDDLPQIYLWLGDALLRTRELAQARTILEEAMGKWPADVRFAKPLALTYATFGQGREAVRTLRRYLDRYPNDPEALPLGVEWIYHLHTAGAVAQTPADDVRMARTYAAAYEKIKGPQLALLKEWLQYIERGRR